MRNLDPRPVRLYGVLGLLGVVLGGAQLAAGTDPVGPAPVATANWIHVGLGAAALAGVALTRPWAYLRRPLTADGWADLVSGLRWRNPVGILAVLVMAYTPVRAGFQVLAGLDPDFTRDAWGGPSYAGAAAAHWLDGLLIFFAAATVLRMTVTPARRRRDRGRTR
jgi:hypothetical protein